MDRLSLREKNVSNDKILKYITKFHKFNKRVPRVKGNEGSELAVYIRKKCKWLVKLSSLKF